MVVGLAADAAADPHLAHHLEHGLARLDGARPGSARRHMATCLRPQPLAVREKISATAARSSGLVGLAGCASA